MDGMSDLQTHQAIETAKLLWVALGALLASNAGVFIKFYLDHRVKAREKAEVAEKEKEAEKRTELTKLTAAVEANTKAMRDLETDLQRVFTAVKLVAGDKWTEISKVIQQDHPRIR